MKEVAQRRGKPRLTSGGKAVTKRVTENPTRCRASHPAASRDEDCFRVSRTQQHILSTNTYSFSTAQASTASKLAGNLHALHPK
jgi:hypothetical protein